jgi:hypothetical protein
LLETLDDLDFTKVTGLTTAFSGCTSLVNLKLRNLGVACVFSECPLSYESLMYLINNLKTVSSITLTLGATNLSKLTASEISIATNKGWIVN